MWSTCWPLTVMMPASGRMRPRISLSTTDFPEPLSPSRMRIAPFGMREAHVVQDDVIVEGQRDTFEFDDGRGLFTSLA